MLVTSSKHIMQYIYIYIYRSRVARLGIADEEWGLEFSDGTHDEVVVSTCEKDERKGGAYERRVELQSLLAGVCSATLLTSVPGLRIAGGSTYGSKETVQSPAPIACHFDTLPAELLNEIIKEVVIMLPE